MSDGESGPFMLFNSIYLYTLIGLGIFKLLRFNIKNSGFFSKQSLLIILSIIIPLAANILGSLKVIPMTIYVTPICFSFSILLLAIAIFKFNFLTAAPIALQKVVDRISDSYLILDESNTIIDFNKPFLLTFEVNESEIRNKNIIPFVNRPEFQTNIKKFETALKRAKNTSKTQRFNETFGKIFR